MAVRTYHIADDNSGSYGKIIATGIPENGDFFVETNKIGQYGIVNFSRSYIRNPYYFGISLNLYKLVFNGSVFEIYETKSRGSQKTISSFGDFVIFCDKRITTGIVPNLVADYSSSFCQVINKQSYNIYDSTMSAEDQIDTIVLGSDIVNSIVIPVDISSLSDYGYDVYILVSNDEAILCDIFAIVKGNGIDFSGKDPHGLITTSFSVSDYGICFSDISIISDLDPLTKFNIGNINDWAVKNIIGVQVIVFLGEDCIYKSPSEYDFEIEDTGDMILTFLTALTALEAQYMTILLIKDSSPDIAMKHPNGFAGNGFYCIVKNFDYSLLEANYRTR